MESNQPLMSVKEARKRLGKRYAHLADKQVENLVTLLSKIAAATVQEG